MKTVKRWVVVLWSQNMGFMYKICESEHEATAQRGFGDFVGMSEINLKLPEYYDENS